MTDPNKPVRKTIVTGINIAHMKPGDPFYPDFSVPENETPEEIWWVSIRVRSGLLPESSLFWICSTQDEALELQQQHPVGAEIDTKNKDPWLGMTDKKHAFLLQMMELGLSPVGANAGDEASPLAFDTLDAAGITDGFNLNPAVLDFLGKQRIGELKSKHGENWNVAAAYQYCLLNLPHSSPAYIAAAYQFHWYISGDEFKAGYLWRDLECVAMGVESEAIKAVEMRKKAGEKGSERSARARKRRIEALMSALEKVAERNPDIAAILGPKSLLAIAIPEAAEADPSLWTQGQGQAEEYLGEVRRGEAGKGLQSRYQRLFTQKTA